MEKENRKKEKLYKCSTCNFVLKQRRGESPPSFCPNCALHNHKGEMVLVGESVSRRLDLKIETFRE